MAGIYNLLTDKTRVELAKCIQVNPSTSEVLISATLTTFSAILKLTLQIKEGNVIPLLDKLVNNESLREVQLQLLKYQLSFPITDLKNLFMEYLWKLQKGPNQSIVDSLDSQQKARVLEMQAEMLELQKKILPNSLLLIAIGNSNESDQVNSLTLTLKSFLKFSKEGNPLKWDLIEELPDWDKLPELVHIISHPKEGIICLNGTDRPQVQTDYLLEQIKTAYEMRNYEKHVLFIIAYCKDEYRKALQFPNSSVVSISVNVSEEITNSFCALYYKRILRPNFKVQESFEWTLQCLQGRYGINSLKSEIRGYFNINKAVPNGATRNLYSTPLSMEEAAIKRHMSARIAKQERTDAKGMPGCPLTLLDSFSQMIGLQCSMRKAKSFTTTDKQRKFHHPIVLST